MTLSIFSCENESLTDYVKQSFGFIYKLVRVININYVTLVSLFFIN